jgi:hypothetical protein
MGLAGGCGTVCMTKRPAHHRARSLQVLAAVAGAFVIAVAIGFWSLQPICCHPVGDPMRLDAASLASAAMLYLRENGAENCPTTEELKRELFLDRARNTDDVWGTAFRIECEAERAVVVSAGPDLVFDTEDDF